MSTLTEEIHDLSDDRWTAFRNDLRVIHGLSLRWFRETLTEPVGAVIMLSIRPLVWFILFGSMFETVSTLPVFPTDNYKAFIFPGIVSLMTLEYMMVGGQCVVKDIQDGFLQKMWAAPISKVSVVVGRLVVMSTFNVVQVAFLFGVAFFVGMPVAAGPVGVALVFVMSVLLTSTVTALSLFTAYTVQHEFAFSAVTSFFVLPVVFVSNAFMPAELMPDWLGTLAAWNPVSVVTTAMRTLIVDGWVQADVLPALALLVVGFLASTALTAFSFTRTIDGERMLFFDRNCAAPEGQE